MKKYFEKIMTDPSKTDGEQASAAGVLGQMDQIEQELPDVPKKGDMSGVLENKNILRKVIREEIKKVLKY
jgi:hypothetical protein